MHEICIQQQGIRVRVAPAYGSRVVSLIDTNSGRDWLAPGSYSKNVGDEARYLLKEAVGWDECFPNVDSFEAAQPWNRRLRDHGLLWGRPWAVLEHSASAVTTSFEDPLFSFVRRLRCQPRRLVAEYELTNRSVAPLPFLWAAHILLAVSPGERIRFDSRSPPAIDFISPAPRALPDSMMRSSKWLGFEVDRVQPIDTGVAAKLYFSSIEERTIHVDGTGGCLRVGWSPPWESVGLWLNYGGWPEIGQAHHIAIEPTTRPKGTFVDADAELLASGARITWEVELGFEH